MNAYQDKDHPTLILMRGLPGSGKSYLTASLQKHLGEDAVVVLDPDATDYESDAYIAFSNKLSTDGVDAKFHPYRFLRSKAYAGITAHKVIIWNQPFTNLDGFTKTIINLQTYAAEHGTRLPILLVEVEVDHAIARGRIMKRKQEGGHGPSEGTFTRFANDYVSFSDQGHNTVQVYGTDDLSVSVSSIIKALHGVWER